jgi:hypothetical protein
LAIALSAGRTAAAAPGDAQAAFRAAFGAEPVRHVVQTSHPPGAAKGDNYGEDAVDLTLKPGLLAPLGGERYALVASETNVMGAHASPGAVAIAYLRRTGGRWTVEKTWPEFIWSGNSGNPADAIKILSFSKTPMVALASDFMGGGQATDTTWIIRLDATGPKYVGQVPSGGRVEPEDTCDDCAPYEYRGSIGPPRRRGDALSVTYAGRVRTAHGRWRPIHRKVDFRLRDGELVPTTRLVLPWLTLGGG